MSETNTTYEPTAADIKEAALAMGMPEKTENERRAEWDEFERGLVEATLSDKDLEAIHERSYERSRSVNKQPRIGLGRRVLVGAGLTLATLGAAATPQGETVIDTAESAVEFVADQANELVTNDNDTVQPVEPGSPESGMYNARPGDTPNGIALKVEENIDGIAGNQEHRELQSDIVKQAGEDGLMPGEDIHVPAAADTDPNTPNVQL